MTDAGDEVPQLGAHVPPPDFREIRISGDALAVIQALIPRVRGATTEKDVLLRGVSVLQATVGCRIQFVDAQDRVLELDPIWR